MAEETLHDTPRFGRDDVERVETQTLQQGFFRLEKRQLRHRLFNGGWSDVITREVHVRRDAVGVLLYDVERDSVVLVEQVRAGALDDARSPWKLEPVAGLVEQGENPADVARREAVEEAGCTIGELIELHTYYPSPGACDEQVTLFLGLVDSCGLGGVHGLEDENEDILVHVIPFARAWELLDAGRLDNAMCLIAFYWLARERASLRARR
ncbi:NUDIX domain-containing protein [Halomonas sp. McH1-25]|uniref:NUDIX domain-containing protein n=1 Tax=unclassified Halomonas TaxID=2609666 RepID=UPI001EF3FE2F|nr:MULTISPECIES: NUDIX domain-containing protein [unclassified Halomonas]MCG7600371.1 NUDIX domain-containing protein [Halomonas sp. McH1-25]MCP1343993.1 NUDIX domain-containing protein [Halomonas sp. FL8]MCP1361497.1 NUDIX domain-containing protein [Halomonas sp. BBD45]MCP1366450.1 NUDIX domain-containing protein [Halomonas sp. BBD48]